MGIEPIKTARHKSAAMRMGRRLRRSAQTPAARKKGRNPWRRIAGPAAARRAEFDAFAATSLGLP